MSLATISSCETWRDYVKLDNAYAIGYGRQVLPEDLPGACFVMAPLVAYLRVSHSARSLEAVHKQLQVRCSATPLYRSFGTVKPIGN